MCRIVVVLFKVARVAIQRTNKPNRHTYLTQFSLLFKIKYQPQKRCDVNRRFYTKHLNVHMFTLKKHHPSKSQTSTRKSNKKYSTRPRATVVPLLQSLEHFDQNFYFKHGLYLFFVIKSEFVEADGCILTLYINKSNAVEVVQIHMRVTGVVGQKMV